MSSSIPLLFTLRSTQSILRGPSRFVILRSLSSSATATSVNPTEISHFNALASTWWDPHGSSRILHLMNPLRHDFITSCLTSSSSHPTKNLAHHDDDVNNNNNNQSLDGLRYLDIGCGGGIFAESAARLATTGSVTGIDPSEGVIAVAREHARQDPIFQQQDGKLEYLHTSVEDLTAAQRRRAEGDKQQGYDIVTLFEVIEHINYPAPFLASCLEFVKPGGWLVLSTIARTWTSWATTKVVAEELLGVVPRGTHDWAKYINEEELRGFFRGREGWSRMRSMGCVFVPGLGWKMVPGGERWGNYFFGVRREAGEGQGV